MSNRTKVLLTVDQSGGVADMINGRIIELLPNEPLELDEFIADAVVRHIGHLHGIVEVKQTKTKRGIEWDVEEALERAVKYLDECEKKIVSFYVRQQLEDRIQGGKPALPPTGRALEVITKRKINLKNQYGISPIGWTDPGADSPNQDPHTVVVQNNEQVTQLQQELREKDVQIDLLQQSVNGLAAKMEKLLTLLGNDEPETVTVPEQGQSA